MRTLERAFGTLALATLAVRRGVAVQEGVALAEVVGEVAEHSRVAWRSLVVGGTQFYDFFRAVTPIDVIERMQIGEQRHSTPQGVGIGAVPPAAWVFAWSQSRHMLPGWYGAGAGLKVASEARGIALLRRAYAGWPFFRHLVDDIEATLGRADLVIAASYDELAPADTLECARAIHAEYVQSCAMVLRDQGDRRCWTRTARCSAPSQLRNPYVDPMNLMQIDLLRRWRASGRDDEDLFEALLASVSGIAQGLQTTG